MAEAEPFVMNRDTDGQFGPTKEFVAFNDCVRATFRPLR